MEIVLKHGAATHTIAVPTDARLIDLRVGVESVTGVLCRQQKLLCRGKAATTQKRNAAARVPSAPSTSQARARVWAASGMASLGRGTGDGDAAPPLAAWPGDLLATAPSLRVLRCVGALSPAAPPAGIPLRPFAGLVRLTLAGCALPSEAIDWGGLAVLTRLTRLSLRDNALRTLPLALGDLPALQELDLANNQLETLPSSALPGWLSLTVLNVSCNRLKALPPELGSCAALEVLAAQGNQLEELPRQLAALQSLKILTLEGNRIRSVPPTILTNCVALCTLGLHDNPITVEELRETEGWASYDARRRAKYDKQLESSVLGSSMDEGADAHPVQNWK